MESVMRRMMGRPHQHNDIEMGHLVLTAEQRDAMSQNNMVCNPGPLSFIAQSTSER